VNGTGAFLGMLAGEAAIFSAALLTNISYLWYNVIGCVVVVLAGIAVSITTQPPLPHTLKFPS
jgi:solute:Na+ symporter, SSS family